MTEHYSKQAVSDTSQRVTEEARSSFESNSMRVGYAMGDLERDANGKYVYLGMEASFDSYLMGWIARGKQEAWISVEDRLPAPNVRVRVWFRDTGKEWRERYGEINCGHWRPEGGNGNFDDYVTHWMHTAAAPTETGQ